MKLWCKKINCTQWGLIPCSYWSQAGTLTTTLSNWIQIAGFYKNLSLLHHKKLGQLPGWTWDNAQVEPGKYTSNCRENKAGTNPSYSWGKNLALAGIWAGNIFPCYIYTVAGNVPNYRRYITRPPNAFITVCKVNNYFSTCPSNPWQRRYSVRVVNDYTWTHNFWNY